MKTLTLSSLGTCHLSVLSASLVFSNMFRIILLWLLCREHGIGVRNAMRLKSRYSRAAFCLLFFLKASAITEENHGNPLTVSLFTAEQPQRFSLSLAVSPSTATKAEPRPVSCWVWVPMPAASNTCQSFPSFQARDANGLLGSSNSLSKLYSSAWILQE